MGIMPPGKISGSFELALRCGAVVKEGGQGQSSSPALTSQPFLTGPQTHGVGLMQRRAAYVTAHACVCSSVFQRDKWIQMGALESHSPQEAIHLKPHIHIENTNANQDWVPSTQECVCKCRTVCFYVCKWTCHRCRGTCSNR